MPSEILVATLIVAGHALGMVAEYRLHARNLAVLEEHGGKAQAPELMSALYAVWALAVPLAVAAGLLSHAAPERLWQAVGIGIVGMSQLFRRWAIHSLGVYWTMGIVALRGLRPLNAGPYRLLKNPEYISRFTELCGVALATGAFGLSGLGLAVATALMLKAGATEGTLLYGAGGANLAPDAKVE